MQKLLNWFDEEISNSQKKQKTLTDDQRKDEAIFEKIQENVYDIFRTVLKAALRQHGQDEAAVRRFFEARLQQLPTAWEQSLLSAQQHNDMQREHIEKIKLSALNRIRLAYSAHTEEKA